MTDRIPVRRDAGGQPTKPRTRPHKEQTTPRNAHLHHPAGRIGSPRPAEDAHQLAVLNRLMRVILNNRDDIDRLADAIVVLLAESIGDMCALVLLNQHNDMMHVAAFHDTDPSALHQMQHSLSATADIPRDTGLTAQVIRTVQPQLVPSVDQRALRAAALPATLPYVDEVGISGFMSVPLTGRNGVLGTLNLSRHRGGKSYEQADLDFLIEASVRISMAIENCLLMDSLRSEIAGSSSAKGALSASEERFRSIFESTTLGIELMDPSGILVDTNHAFELMTGFSRAELIGRHFGSLQHPEDALPVRNILKELQASRERGAPFENRILRRDGTTIWVKTDLAAVKQGARGEDIGFIVAVHEDITRRKQTEQYFQAVLEATPDALVMVNGQGKILLVNRQTEALFGYGRHEIISQGIEMLIPERFREMHPLHRSGYLLDPHTRPMGAGMELFGLRKDGTEMPVEISLSPLQMDDAIVVVAAIRDITARRERQAALIRSERNLAEAQRVARLGSLEWDLATGRLDASDEALRIFGIQRADFHGTETLRAHLHPDDESKMVGGSDAAIQSRTPRELEFRVLHPDGQVRIIHDRVVPYFDADGKPVRVLGTIQDVTEQRQAEKEMVELKSHLQSSAELERLHLAQELHDGPMQDLYGASYRINQLLETASSQVQASLRAVDEDLQDTVAELRDIARELRPPAISRFGLEKAIRSYAEDFRQKSPDIKLHLSLAQDHQLLPENMRMTLFRVFQQALTNVLRHSQASEVRVRFSLDAEEARLEVTDNGLGFSVPPNWMSFVRHGHYGLAGAAERVSALGGTLLVQSEPHHATTITAVIPWTPGSEAGTGE